jgi:copper resistance protein D
VVRRFSRLGYVAVGLLVITGLVNSLVLVGGPAALIGTDYGRVLSIKLGLFGAMLAIAAFNRFVVSPGLQSGDPKAVAILRRSVAIELGVGAGVLAVVAALGTVHPPS